MVFIEPPHTMHACVAGFVTHDLYGEELVPGGAAYYAARTFASLGATVELITGFGEGFAGLADLKGIKIQADVREATTTFTNSYEQNGTRGQRVEYLGLPLRPEMFHLANYRADVLYLAPVLGEIDLALWRQSVHAPTVGLGLQGWLRDTADDEGDSGSRAVTGRPYDLDPVQVTECTAVFFSQEDAAQSGDRDLMQRMRSLGPIVVETAGHGGSTIASETERFEVGVYAGAPEVDPTGAGDTYAAAFLFAMASGASPVEAAQLGAAAASIVIEAVGGGALNRLGDAHTRAAAVPVHRF